MLRSIAFSILGFVAASALWVSQCSGPKPVFIGAPRVDSPQQPGDPYRVEATIRNEGLGHGEARVTFRLVDQASHEAYLKDEPIQLERGETAHVIVEILAPPADYQPRVDVEYPPR